MEEKFVITIARGYGSGGRTMGNILAEKLGVPCYDREILRMASDASGISEELFGKADEKVRKVFLGSKGKYTGKPLGPESNGFISNDNLFEIQADLIRKLAETESCVIVGRCADYILRDMPHVHKTYFYASEEDCLARLKKRDSGSDEELIKKIRDIDKYRSDYYKYYTGHDWDNASNYDLCMNTASMSYEKIAEAVISYLNIKNS